jgi:dihydrofolate reductase
MRKIIVSMMVSVDGFISDKNEEINWHVWDKEMENYMLGFFDEVDTLVFGRKTYELMQDYWPTEKSVNESPGIAAKMNGLPKIVFSSSLQEASWSTSTLLKKVEPKEIELMKEEPGKDMVIFGGADLIASFAKLDLIDEYRLIVNPVALGEGKPLFKDLKEQLNLKLMNTQRFSCGNVLTCYQPQSKK